MLVADHAMLPPAVTVGLVGLMVQAAWLRLGNASADPSSVRPTAAGQPRRRFGYRFFMEPLLFF